MLHIMVFLKYLGSYGNEASLQKIGPAMCIPKGAINDCVIWMSQAILKLQKMVIRWPDDKEQKQIGSRIKQAHGFVICVGLIDGTLSPLAIAGCDVYLSKEKYFSNKEYLLGDLAFSASMVMVPAFKKGQNATLSEERKYFNTKLAKVQISERCIGLLKARFHVYKSLGGL